MIFESTAGPDVRVVLSRAELVVLNDALREALEAVDDWEFGIRTAGTKDEMRELLDAIGGHLRESEQRR